MLAVDVLGESDVSARDIVLASVVVASLLLARTAKKATSTLPTGWRVSPTMFDEHCPEERSGSFSGSASASPSACAESRHPAGADRRDHRRGICGDRVSRYAAGVVLLTIDPYRIGATTVETLDHIGVVKAGGASR
jgi:hypothetical protein